MRWKDLGNGLLTAALSGGATTAGAMFIDPEHFNLGLLKHLSIVFVAGAIMAVLNWLRQSPWKQTADPAMSVDPRRFTSVVLVVGATLALAACGQSVRHIAVSADAGFYTAITSIDDAQFSRCHPTNLPPNVAWAPSPWCQQTEAPIKAALQHGLAATKALRALPRDTASLPKDLPDLAADLVTLRDIIAPFTNDPTAATIAAKTTQALTAALNALAAFAGGK